MHFYLHFTLNEMNQRDVIAKGKILPREFSSFKFLNILKIFLTIINPQNLKNNYTIKQKPVIKKSCENCLMLINSFDKLLQCSGY